MSGLKRLPPAGGAPWEDVPAEKVLCGTPRTRTWVLYENLPDRLYAGEWEATPGKWRISYNEWEYVEVISGACVIEGDGGERIEAGPGDEIRHRTRLHRHLGGAFLHAEILGYPRITGVFPRRGLTRGSGGARPRALLNTLCFGHHGQYRIC